MAPGRGRMNRRRLAAEKREQRERLARAERRTGSN